MKKEEEIRNYNPWGKGGAGAPLRDTSGQLVSKYSKVFQQEIRSEITTLGGRVGVALLIEMHLDN